MRLILAGVLLCAAPLFSSPASLADPVAESDQLRWFRLDETRADIANMFGQPAMVSSFGNDLESWQYRLGETEEEGYSHQFLFRKSGRLISVARNYFPERSVDELFPQSVSTTWWYPDSRKREFGVRLRPLANNTFLLAMGVTKPGQTTGQLFLIRGEAMPALMPWLASQLSGSVSLPPRP